LHDVLPGKLLNEPISSNQSLVLCEIKDQQYGYD
jgi:hypothetical protein